MTGAEQRAAWLERRRQGIGASDAASVCGLEGAFSSPLGVWLDKMGRLPLTASPAMQWGLRLEEVIAAAYEEETGRHLLRHSPYEVLQHPDIPWMLATLDRETTCGRVVQIKTASAYAKGWGEPGTDEVPDVYNVQVHQEMAVTGLEVADIPVLFGAHDFRVYTVERNEQLIRDLITIEGDFWALVERREPPEVDWQHPDTPKLLEHLHRPDPAVTVSLDGNAALLWEDYEMRGKALRELEKQREEVKARIVEALGGAGVGLLPDGRQLLRSQVCVKERVAKAYEYYQLRCKKARE